MQTHVDLNSDLGEAYGPWAMGDDAAMLKIVSSANVACGGHAGDPETMYQTLVLAKQNGVSVGAHPGYEDKLGFGRRIIPMSSGEIERMVAAQIGTLLGVAALAGASVNYIKPHGALANLAAAERTVADAIARAVRAVTPNLAILAISGTQLEPAAQALGIETFSEIFADRAYLPSGQLVPRSHPGSVIKDSATAANRLLDFFSSGLMPTLEGSPIRLAAHSICVHGDSAGAVEMAAKIHASLTNAGIKITSFLDRNS